MKPIIFILLFAANGITIQAQILKPVIKKSTVPAPPPPPPASTYTPVYSLTSARVNIKTGSDNKEYLSTVTVLLDAIGAGSAMFQPGENLRNEMKINSNFEFGLINPNWTTPDANRLLTSFQKTGLTLSFYYLPNLLTDAWKIEGITLTLEFRDQNKNLHPALGIKTIVFNNANGFLNWWDRKMECRADASFTPLTSSIKNN
jgi:hypothetical protein